MKPRVYIETTIPSFYHEVRTAPDMLARRQWTREWWDEARGDYALVTSVAVVDELSRGDFPQREQALALINDLPLVPVEAAIAEIVKAYIQHKVMPHDPVGDALHLALAAYHKCDFLLTWNCRHLANANKFGHIRRVNVMLGLYSPLLVTPLELLGGRDESEG
jgi:predicted nucleic acid-binding protein